MEKVPQTLVNTPSPQTGHNTFTKGASLNKKEYFVFIQIFFAKWGVQAEEETLDLVWCGGVGPEEDGGEEQSSSWADTLKSNFHCYIVPLLYFTFFMSTLYFNFFGVVSWIWENPHIHFLWGLT